MATFTEENIPAVHTRMKLVPRQFLFEGTELDKGQGSLIVVLGGRIVDEQDEPILDEQGNFTYHRNDQRTLQEGVSSALPVVIDGISGAQVLSWLGKYVDLQLAKG